MKNLLNDQDPLPEFKPNSIAWHLPVTNRHREEARKEKAKKQGEDWRPAPDAIYPTTQVNGQGKFQTKDYKPPEPPETDIPIPCVYERIGIGEFMSRLSKCRPDLALAIGPMTYDQGRQHLNQVLGCSVQGNEEIGVGFGKFIFVAERQAEPQTQTAIPEEKPKEWPFPVIPLFTSDGWIPHKPGDPMPCDPRQKVQVRLRDGRLFEGDEADYADFWGWDSCEDFPECEITAWKPAT